VRVRLSREAWCGKDKPGVATVRLGPVAISEGRQATIRKVLQQWTTVIHSCTVREVALRTPGVPWLVEVTIDPTFSPRELDPKLSDPRQLGAVVNFGYEPLS